MRSVLANYVRYMALIRFQEEALEEEDLDRFETLAEARGVLQEELGAGPPAFPDGEELDQERRDYLEGIYEHLRESVQRDARLQLRLKELKQGVSRDLEGMKGRDKKLKGYLEKDEAVTGERESRLNVRL
jgi:hypothetical protein